MTDKHIETALVQAGRAKRYTQGSVNSVIQRASSLVFDSVDAKKQATAGRAQGELFYGRRGTLTHFSLQEAMCELEGGAGCALFPCGAAAVANTILAFVEQGDHVLVTNSAYEPTQDFCTKILTKFGVTTTWFDPLAGDDIAKHLQPNTKVVFLESPGSITMEVHDVPAIVAAVRRTAPDAIIMMDNTWSAGILFKALDFGVDISIQAGTKYLVGHSDAMIGTAVANARCWDTLRENAYLMGQMADADSAMSPAAVCARWRCVCASIMKAACAWRSGWRRTRRWRASITRRCRAAKAMNSGNAISAGPAASSLLFSTNVLAMKSWRIISIISRISAWPIPGAAMNR